MFLDKEILFIDDEHLVRIVVRDILTELGYKVSCFSNGFDAINYYEFNKENISLVISDMMMPEICGKDVFYKLKEINDQIKFIILTGFSNKNDDDFLNSITDYLTKPITLNTLKEAIEKALK